MCRKSKKIKSIKQDNQTMVLTRSPIYFSIRKRLRFGILNNSLPFAIKMILNFPVILYSILYNKNLHKFSCSVKCKIEDAFIFFVVAIKPK